MRLSLFRWVQLVAVALVVTVLLAAARDRLRSERHCLLVATLVVDCR
jgi:hypothetical protein